MWFIKNDHLLKRQFGIVDLKREKMENKKIWTPFKIWNETQWFTEMDSLIEKYNKDRKKRLVNNFWKNKCKN